MAEQSRNEEILRSIIDETEYDKTPQSREEELLLELKQAIEGGGSSVVPNPEGEATETLNKLGIDDTVYGIPKELPAVTSADAGNVLGVNDEGQWAKMAASGSGEKFAVFSALASNSIAEDFILQDGYRQIDIVNEAESGKVVFIQLYRKYSSTITRLTGVLQVVRKGTDNYYKAIGMTTNEGTAALSSIGISVINLNSLTGSALTPSSVSLA